MFDNVSWPSSMWGWIAAAPDPAVVGDAWQEMWRTRIQNADFWFKQWAPLNVSVAGAVWAASYDMSKAPTTWTLRAMPVWISPFTVT